MDSRLIVQCICRYMLWYIYTQYSLSESSPVMDSRVASCRPAVWKSKKIVQALKFGFQGNRSWLGQWLSRNCWRMDPLRTFVEWFHCLFILSRTLNHSRYFLDSGTWYKQNLYLLEVKIYAGHRRVVAHESCDMIYFANVSVMDKNVFNHMLFIMLSTILDHH